jgi:hypothetical protein
MTTYIATWYNSAKSGFYGAIVDAKTKETAKRNFTNKNPDKMRLLTIRTFPEFITEFLSRNKPRLYYMLPAPKGSEYEWMEFMKNPKHAGGDWGEWPLWVRNHIKQAAIDRVKRGKYVW